MGLNFGIDFQGGTTIRTESTQPSMSAPTAQALEALDLGDVSITEVFDPSFARRPACRDDPHLGAGRGGSGHARD